MRRLAVTGGAGRTAAAGPRAAGSAGGERLEAKVRRENAARQRGVFAKRGRESQSPAKRRGVGRWGKTNGQKIGAGWGGKIQQGVRHSTGKTRRGGGGGEAARRAEGDGRSWQSIAAAMRAANAALVAGSDGAMGEALDMARQCQGEVVFAIFGK